MAHLNITGFGKSLKQVNYANNWDWFVTFSDFEELYKAQPSYIFCQAAFLLGFVCTFIHSLCKGGRWPYVFFATIIHGLVVESISYHIPEIDNFWHSRTPIDFLGGRLPLYIIGLYTVFIYNAFYAISRLQLPGWVEPLAVGLTVVLIDIPYDIISVKYVHWTWHDTDPNIYDRHYWVPWNSYYFHVAFATSFVFWFNYVHRLTSGGSHRTKSAGFFKEILSMLAAGLLGMPGGILIFIPLYHPLHDIIGIHSENTFFILFTIYMVLILTGLRTPRPIILQKVSFSDCILLIHLAIHYLTFLFPIIFYNPEDVVSVGLHEPVGKCDEIQEIKNAIGMTLKKRKYLCVTDYNEDYFDFHCLPKGKIPPEGSMWYTVCGTPFQNRAEYIAIMVNIIIIAVGVFYNCYMFATPVVQKVEENRKKKKQ